MADPNRTLLDRADIGSLVPSLNHASRHAAGGADPVTPEDIKAYPTEIGTLTSADNLDTLTTPGTYFLGNSSGVTTANGFPLDGWAGWVEVQNRFSSTIQKAFSIYSGDGAGNTSGNAWVRTQVGGVWEGWLRLDPGAVIPSDIGALASPLTYPGVGPHGQVTNNGVIGQAFDVDTWTEPGVWWVSGYITTANGFPWTPHTFGVLINEWANASSYMRQTVQTSQDGWLVCMWTRVNRGGTWGAWVPIKVDTGWRKLPAENGWTGDIYVKRTESLVHVSCTNLNGSAAANTNLFTLPGDSYYPGASRPQHGMGHVSSASLPGGSAQNTVGGIGATGGTNNEIVRLSGPATSWVNGSASMTFPPASTSLPATLPGTPG